VAVGTIDVAVGGMDVVVAVKPAAVGAIDVAVGGMDVLVGGMGVLVGGIGVLVAGIGVGVKPANAGATCQAMVITRTKAIQIPTVVRVIRFSSIKTSLDFLKYDNFRFPAGQSREEPTLKRVKSMVFPRLDRTYTHIDFAKRPALSLPERFWQVLRGILGYH